MSTASNLIYNTLIYNVGRLLSGNGLLSIAFPRFSLQYQVYQLNKLQAMEWGKNYAMGNKMVYLVCDVGIIHQRIRVRQNKWRVGSMHSACSDKLPGDQW